MLKVNTTSINKWRDAIKFLVGLGCNSDLSKKDQTFLTNLSQGFPLTLEQARSVLKDAGWVPPASEALSGTLAEYERSVFRNNMHFTVFRHFGPGNRKSQIFATFPEAIEFARQDVHMLVYVVSFDGRSVCLPRTEWDDYLKIWNER